MAAGSVQRERATDQQCDECGLWYDRRGIRRHERNCDGDPDVDDDRNDRDEVPTYDPEPDPEQSVMTDDDNTPTCPECGNTDNVITSTKALRTLRENGNLTEQAFDQLTRHDYYCDTANCRTVFSE